LGGGKQRWKGWRKRRVKKRRNEEREGYRVVRCGVREGDELGEGASVKGQEDKDGIGE